MRIPDAVHEELLNWSRWCWAGEWPHPLPRTHCGSLESQYRALDWNPDDAPPPLPIRPNERNARRVQKVYDDLEGFGRLVLKSEYPCRRERGSRQLAAIRIGLSVSQYENWLQIAIDRVGAAFAPDTIYTNRERNIA